MIDNEDVFDVLANGRRRRLLVRLATHNSQDVPELSGVTQEIAISDEGLLQQHLSSSPVISGVDEELLRLHYIHLPKLANYGFVEWNRDDNVVTKGPRFDEMKPILELLTDQKEEGPVVLIRQ